MAELFDWPATGAHVIGSESITRREAEGAAPDWREREQALDVRSSWIVEAPAGSGKTGLLIQRYLKLLAEGEVEQPEQVLAITFTKAATAEIHERVTAELEAAVAGTEVAGSFAQTTRSLAEAVLRRDAEAGWGLLDSSRRFHVRTIDSICAEIARSMPITSGGTAGIAPVEEPGAMYREAARRTLLQLGGSDALLDGALRTVLLHRDGSLGECERLIAEMLATRDQWGDLVPLGRDQLTDASLEAEVRPRLNRTLEVEVCRGLTELARVIPPSTLNDITLLAAEMGHAPGYGESPSPVAICAGVTSSPGEGLEHLEHWQALIHLLIKNDGEWRAGFRSDWLQFSWDNRHTDPIKGLIARLQDQPGVLDAIQRFNKLPPARYPDEQWAVTKALFRVLSRALVDLQLVFAERGECDFAEPALLARAALRHEGGVEGFHSATGLELRHLLVDEMQDTSTSQYELIELLTEGWNSEGRTVFLVGDPKQSIYLFRQARVERFVATMRRGKIGQLPMGRLRLSANFRSQAGLVEGFNGNFARIFPPSADQEDDVPFVSAQAVRATGSGLSGEHGLAWHAATASGTQEELSSAKQRIVRRNAVSIRQIAERWRRRPLPPGRTAPWRIAVLVRSRRELREIVAALKRDRGAGAVPFRAVKVEPLNERQEVLDLLALTRALKHSSDRVAWWAVLRAPWCGLSLADLHMLAGADDAQFAETTVMELLRSRGDLLSPDGIARLQRVWPVLEAATAKRSRVRTPELVERTWRSLGGDAVLTDSELSNAVRFLDLLNELDADAGQVEMVQLNSRVQRLYAEPQVEPHAVELMTIHGAKGLEWDVVVVPELERKAPPVRSRLLDWEEIVSEDEGAAGVVLAPIQGRGEDSAALNRWLRGVRAARETAERRRLFYVACTRAREELHLFGTAAMLKDGTIKAENGSLLEAAWPAAAARFEAVLNAVDTATPVVEGLALAAAADEVEEDLDRSAVVDRLPLSFDPRTRFAERALVTADREGQATIRPKRPEGSFAARSFGNAVHTFLEMAAHRLALHAAPSDLLAEVPRWKERASALLRADGLASAVVDRLAARVLAAVSNTLRDPAGMWLLLSQTDARSEYALTRWEDGDWSRVRMDRMFRAGASPQEYGSERLWIVDYKTASHALVGVEAFLEAEKEKYARKMEEYARATGERQVRLGLWYPLLSRLVWWIASE